MSEDEIVKVERPKMTPTERMAKARAARAINRAAAQAEPVTRQVKKPPIVEEKLSRTSPVTTSRTRPDGKTEVIGRGGEVLSRTQVQVSDVFEIPQSMIPQGWSYQWNSVSIHGNSDILTEQNHDMYMNGWRPVPAERYAGTLMPVGSKGNIVRRQMMLVERPMALTLEARAEDIRNAHQLISDRNESLKIAGVKNNMGQGFEMSNKASGIRMQIDKSLDVLNVNRQGGNYTVEE